MYLPIPKILLNVEKKHVSMVKNVLAIVAAVITKELPVAERLPRRSPLNTPLRHYFHGAQDTRGRFHTGG
ncbi:15424_t:CDS:2 [Gigaspora margarita]|uniref:15424_t:CDS:1 n=1 Tax=Gigaspora margarita TaxID=4874 RepID=A0ABM8W0B3_GIGMA|nr:15424_t:CDS:2 [Gigaspora margarita]